MFFQRACRFSFLQELHIHLKTKAAVQRRSSCISKLEFSFFCQHFFSNLRGLLFSNLSLSSLQECSKKEKLAVSLVLGAVALSSPPFVIGRFSLSGLN